MMQPVTRESGDYTLTTDRSLLQPEAIHQWLSTESYWAKGIPYQTVKASFDHSFVAGVLHRGRQVAYARLITDYAAFGYLADVYVEAAHRGQGLSKQLLELLFSNDWTARLRRVMLATLDAHKLYESFGFTSPTHPQRLMEITRPLIYEPSGNVPESDVRPS